VRLRVFSQPRIPRVEIPEFEVEWLTFDADTRLFLDPLRGQCRADVAVKALAQRRDVSTVFVLDCDGYYPGLNFVFGLAVPELMTAVVFTARLRGARFEERLAKEITHEAGHLYGLGHCDDPRCVMYFSNSIYDTDRKTPYFCQRCRRQLFRARPYF